ncbi:hypothetical protein CHS0354_017927 [Potamilus streckersoni]|uniref:Uncharacterized protein n=1 Tax=Potamilus streckersoni TaxID=2493646 RepID=A0AAE0RVY7_9BIVA|nr:hypothetical protein CHS0354_017927 [Potamilus streckersoni]
MPTGEGQAVQKEYGHRLQSRCFFERAACDGLLHYSQWDVYSVTPSSTPSLNYPTSRDLRYQYAVLQKQN